MSDQDPKPVPPPVLQPPPVIQPPPRQSSFDVGGFFQQVGDALTSAANSVTTTAQSYELLIQVREAMNTPGDPMVQFLKKTTCHLCGAAKTLPPKTAYVYCDYCGSLTDYDFQMACRTPGSAMPGPAYESLLRTLHSEMELAKQTHDVDRYRDIQLRLFSTWVELCPMAVSPRAKDPEYRDALIRFMAETAVTNDFDSNYRNYATEVAQRTQQMQWTGGYPKVLAHSDSFWPLYSVVREQVEYSYSLLELAGVIEMHPDQAPRRLQERMTWSMFVQGWLPYLIPDDSSKLIRETGLYGEYSRLEPIETTLRHCGSCGGDLRTLPGARAMLCEACGIRIDVEADEVNCANCGAKLSFPIGKDRVMCPYCRSETIRMAW